MLLQYVTNVKRSSVLLQRRYAAPPNQAGLKLKSVIGYNGNGRGNMIWHADSGTWYSVICFVCELNLNSFHI